MSKIKIDQETDFLKKSKGYKSFSLSTVELLKNFKLLDDGIGLNYRQFNRIFDMDIMDELTEELIINFNVFVKDIEDSFTNYNTFSDQINKYICGASETFSRIIDLYLDLNQGLFFDNVSSYIVKCNELISNYIERGILQEETQQKIKDILTIQSIGLLPVNCIKNIEDIKKILVMLVKFIKESVSLINDLFEIIQTIFKSFKDAITVMTTCSLVLSSNAKTNNNYKKMNSSKDYSKRNAVANLAYKKAQYHRKDLTPTNIGTITTNTIKEVLDILNYQDLYEYYVDKTWNSIYVISTPKGY